MSNLINELNAEKKLIQRVTQKYDFKVYNYKKVRSAYKIETDKGTICLKKNNHENHKIINEHLLVKGLIDNNFSNVSKYILTNDGHLFVTINKDFFYATEWINGEEVDLSSSTEVENCSRLLAKFHLATNKINKSQLTIKNNLKKWPKYFRSNLNELEKFKRDIERKKVKNEFDTIYLNYIDTYYSRGMYLLNLLNKSDYQKLCTAQNNNKTICHDSFYYQNIIKMEDNYYIIDLDSITIDLQIYDLGKFIRRLMYKHEYKWSFKKALLIMNAYESVNKLTKSEHGVMIALIMFPHKFCKLGKIKYKKNRGWEESKYLHKLNKLIKCNEAEQKFLNEYMDYIHKEL